MNEEVRKFEAIFTEILGEETMQAYGLDRFCFDREGEPISFIRMLALTTSEEYSRVASTHLPRGEWVSTVWLGTDHGRRISSKPIIFETMVSIDGEWEHALTQRYSTEAEALDGHAKMVSALAARAPDTPPQAAPGYSRPKD